MPEPAPINTGDQSETRLKSPADKTGDSDLRTVASASDESPDRDTQSWEGTEPGESIGLVDPRREIPNPPGL